MIFDFKNFFLFFWAKKEEGIAYFLFCLILFLLPGGSYYENLKPILENPEVLATHFIIPPPALLPYNQTKVSAPSLSAKSVYVIDLVSGVVLYEKNPSLRLMPASTTKIVTALVAMDYFLPSEVLEVPVIPHDGQEIKLKIGERLTVENLLYALLVSSANDAAEVLSASYQGGRENFVTVMNEKVSSLGLDNTHFLNPTGIDQEKQYLSSRDLSILAKEAMKNPLFVKMVATPQKDITSVDEKYFHKLYNLNLLLGKRGIKGVKTGYTLGAGECLVAWDEEKERKILTVVLGSSDRFGETEKLLSWVFNNFQWQSPVLAL